MVLDSSSCQAQGPVHFKGTVIEDKVCASSLPQTPFWLRFFFRSAPASWPHSMQTRCWGATVTWAVAFWSRRRWAANGDISCKVWSLTRKRLWPAKMFSWCFSPMSSFTRNFFVRASRRWGNRTNLNYFSFGFCVAGCRSLDRESWHAVDFLKGIGIIFDFFRSVQEFSLESIDVTFVMWMNSKRFISICLLFLPSSI